MFKNEKLINRWVLQIFPSLEEWKDESEVGSYLATTRWKIKDVVHFYPQKN